MALKEWTPTPKQAVGSAIFIFVVFVVAVGLGLHVAPANMVATAKSHVQTWLAKIKQTLFGSKS